MRFNTIATGLVFGLLAATPFASEFHADDESSSGVVDRDHVGSMAGYAANVARDIPDVEKRHHSSGEHAGARMRGGRGRRSVAVNVARDDTGSSALAQLQDEWAKYSSANLARRNAKLSPEQLNDIARKINAALGSGSGSGKPVGKRAAPVDPAVLNSMAEQINGFLASSGVSKRDLAELERRGFGSIIGGIGGAFVNILSSFFGF